MNKTILSLLCLVSLSFAEKALIVSPEDNTTITVNDLSTFPQHTKVYLKNYQNHTSLLDSQKRYEENYFLPWNWDAPEVTKEKSMWPFNVYTLNKSFGLNLQPLTEEYFELITKKANFDNYLNLSKKAISLHYLNIRNFPTHKPLLYDPSRAGEGFPFDNLQNSGVHANEPLFVSHRSADGEWVFVYTAYVFGWVRERDIAYITDKVSKRYQAAKYIKITHEEHPLYDLQNNFIMQSRVGMLLPIVSINKHSYQALSITQRFAHNSTYTVIKVPKAFADHKILKLNKNNFEQITELMLKSRYGWGGMYEERDCSSMLRDLFAPFGIWLPRNSYKQSRVGKIISFRDLNNTQKEALIKKEAVPFETLLYKKGHIMLYLGVYNNEIAVLHNVWGLKTLKDEKEGRFVIGKTIISSLRIGQELEGYDKENALIDKLQSMNIITQ